MVQTFQSLQVSYKYRCIFRVHRLYSYRNLLAWSFSSSYYSDFLEESMEQTQVRQRPLGVTIISTILAIEGIFEIIVGLLVILGIYALGHTITTHGHTTTGTLVNVAG